jgi:hypothetical protein
MVYGTYNELVTGANLNQLISWGPHIVGFNTKMETNDRDDLVR